MKRFSKLLKFIAEAEMCKQMCTDSERKLPHKGTFAHSQLTNSFVIAVIHVITRTYAATVIILNTKFGVAILHPGAFREHG